MGPTLYALDSRSMVSWYFTLVSLVRGGSLSGLAWRVKYQPAGALRARHSSCRTSGVLLNRGSSYIHSVTAHQCSSIISYDGGAIDYIPLAVSSFVVVAGFYNMYYVCHGTKYEILTIGTGSNMPRTMPHTPEYTHSYVPPLLYHYGYCCMFSSNTAAVYDGVVLFFVVKYY